MCFSHNGPCESRRLELVAVSATPPSRLTVSSHQLVSKRDRHGASVLCCGTSAAIFVTSSLWMWGDINSNVICGPAAPQLLPPADLDSVGSHKPVAVRARRPLSFLRPVWVMGLPGGAGSREAGTLGFIKQSTLQRCWSWKVRCWTFRAWALTCL